MRIKNQDELKVFESFIKEYSECFYTKNIELIKTHYVPDGDVIFFDNHANCDSFALTDHIDKLSHFFKTGIIEELLTEDLVVYKYGDCACLLIKFRYPRQPKPGVRTTYYLEFHHNQWKIRHAHCSFDPNEE